MIHFELSEKRRREGIHFENPKCSLQIKNSKLAV